MTVTDPLVGFIVMALAISAILTLGTLIAAEIIHLGSRGQKLLPRGTETSEPADGPVPALEPLGSSLGAESTVGSRLT